MNTTARDRKDSRAGLHPALGAFDFTLLVVGAVIGADVYIVAAMGAAFLGPAQLMAWLAGGFLAALIALAFVQCAAISPEVGGSYAYTRNAWGSSVGFAAGWALYVGEWVALPVFPIAFLNYLGYFLPGLSANEGVLVKVLLIAAVTGINIISVRAGGRANDALTIAKLLPLGLLILAGIAFVAARPGIASAHLTPFAPLGWGGFGSAVLLIFWAYAGFELAVLPATEIKEPRRTLPRGLLLGMAIATAFYLLTSFAVVVALPWEVAAASPRPLTDAMGAMLPAFGLSAEAGFVLMSVGALVSIVGVYDVFTLSLARLSYALAVDGLFPPWFARIHPRFQTPYLGLLFQAGSAVVAALLFNLTNLIAIAVFFLGICYVLTALSALRLVARFPERALHLPAIRFLLVLGAISGAYLSAQAPLPLIEIGVVVMAAGFVLFLWRKGAWQEAASFRATLHQDELQFERWARARERWLLRFARHLLGS